MNVTSAYGQQDIWNVQELQRARAGYQTQPFPYTTKGGDTVSGDTVSISPQARGLLSDATATISTASPPFEINETNSPEFAAAREKVRNGTAIYGLFGEANAASADVFYTPPAVAAAAPKIFDLASGQPQPDFQAAFANMSSLMREYKNTLKEFGIDYTDNAAFTEFMRNEELRAAVDKAFESRIS